MPINKYCIMSAYTKYSYELQECFKVKKIIPVLLMLPIIFTACIQVQTAPIAPAPSATVPAPATPEVKPRLSPEDIAASFHLPYIAVFNVKPTNTMANIPVTLRWDVKNSTDIMIEPNIGIVEPAGSKEIISPIGTTTYKLKATNAAGTVLATTTLTISVEPPGRDAPVVKQFTASPNIIKKGQSATLKWETVAASAVTVEGKTVPAEGSMQVSPDDTTTYTIIATSTDGTQYQTVTVNVK